VKKLIEDKSANVAYLSDYQLFDNTTNNKYMMCFLSFSSHQYL